MGRGRGGGGKGGGGGGGGGAAEAQAQAETEAAPKAAAPAAGSVAENAQAVVKAVRRLDETGFTDENGKVRFRGANLVPLHSLRERLGHMTREQQDAAIVHLVRERKVSLEVHEGLHGPVPASWKPSAIVRPGRDADTPVKYYYIALR
jgi:hypothetical protein